MDEAGYQAQSFAKRLAADLLELGVHPGGVLLVHASLKSMGNVPGGPETVIRGLSTALGKSGTLLLPGLSYEAVTPQHPIFDIRHTPSCVGTIPEHFRNRFDTLRSLHPTHSVCGVGPFAPELLDPHAQDTTPCGPNSPFHRLPQVNGQILMLGCGLNPNTTIHAIEEMVIPPYLFDSPITYTLTDANGHTFQKTYTPHNFAGWEQRYDRIANFLTPPTLRTGKVARAKTHLIDARNLWRIALTKLRENPLFLVEKTNRM